MHSEEKILLGFSTRQRVDYVHSNERLAKEEIVGMHDA